MIANRMSNILINDLFRNTEKEPRKRLRTLHFQMTSHLPKCGCKRSVSMVQTILTS